MLGRLQIQLMWSNCTLRSVFLADACLWIHFFSSWFTIPLHPMTPAVRTNTSSQYNWPICIYDFFKVPNIENDPASSHLFLLQLLLYWLYRQNRITLLQPCAIYITVYGYQWLYSPTFTIKIQLFMLVNIPFVPWRICIPCAYHSAPPLSVLRVNRFWTSQWMKSPARATKGGPDTLWGFPRFPGHCRSWNPVAIH